MGGQEKYGGRKSGPNWRPVRHLQRLRGNLAVDAPATLSWNLQPVEPANSSQLIAGRQNGRLRSTLRA